MNELVLVKKEQVLTTSLKVAEVFEKRHDHVLESIRDLIGQIEGIPKLQTPLFQESTYINEQNKQEYPMYLMNRDGFSLLVMGFTGEKAFNLKLAFIQNNSLSLKELMKIAIETQPKTLRQGYVYVLEMSNGAIKIGRTVNWQKRFNTISNSSGLKIINSCLSLPIEIAETYKIESALKRHFNSKKIKGEFFKISFKVACEELKKYTEIADA